MMRLMNLKFSACGVYGEQSATGTSLYPSTPLILCHYNPNSAPHWRFVHLPSTLHNLYSLNSCHGFCFGGLLLSVLSSSCVALYPKWICLRVACYWKATNVCL